MYACRLNRAFRDRTCIVRAAGRADPPEASCRSQSRGDRDLHHSVATLADIAEAYRLFGRGSDRGHRRR